MNTTAATPIFTGAAIWLEDGDIIRPFVSTLRVRGVFAEGDDWLRVVVQHIDNVTGDPLADVYTILLRADRVLDVFGAADLG